MRLSIYSVWVINRIIYSVSPWWRCHGQFNDVEDCQWSQCRNVSLARYLYTEWQYCIPSPPWNVIKLPTPTPLATLTDIWWEVSCIVCWSLNHLQRDFPSVTLHNSYHWRARPHCCQLLYCNINIQFYFYHLYIKRKWNRYKTAFSWL